MTEAFSDQVLTLARRSVVRTARQPANVIFPFVFPLLLLAVNAGGLDSATTAAIARADGYRLFALSVDYGQRHWFELEAAARVAKSLGVERHDHDPDPETRVRRGGYHQIPVLLATGPWFAIALL